MRAEEIRERLDQSKEKSKESTQTFHGENAIKNQADEEVEENLLSVTKVEEEEDYSGERHRTISDR